ncbi:MAG: hypothetical protein AABW90_03275, partial [Nanoarchaeota archaeon]
EITNIYNNQSLRFKSQGTLSDVCCLTEKSVCGNNITERREGCDDGNNKNGDGCSDLCKIEQDFDNDNVFDESNAEDTDKDGITNNLDIDDDGDGISTKREIEIDTDGNLVVAYLDPNEKIIRKKKPIKRVEIILEFIDNIIKEPLSLKPRILKKVFIVWLLFLILLILIIYLIYKTRKHRRKRHVNNLKKVYEDYK